MRLHAKALPLLFSALLLLLVAPSAHAADRALLGSFGTPNGEKGGQLTQTKGIAVNRSGNGASSGSLYVAEGSPNHRISQFDADGNFIRTWGYDVIDSVNFPGAPNDNGTAFEICDVTNANTAEECKKGLNGGAAGQLSNPSGIALDQASGYLYVTSTTNRRVDVFTGEGSFVGAFGYDVLPADPNPSGPDFCTTVTGCQTAASAGADAGRFGALFPSNPAVDPNNPGRIYVPDPNNLRVAQYTVTAVGDVLTAASFDKAFGWDVIPANATTTLESCTIATTCQAGTSGNGAGQFASGGSPGAVAVDSAGAIYATSGPLNNGTCSAATPCRVQKFAPDASAATDFGPTEGEGQLIFTAGAANANAAINLAVDPSDDHLYALRKETGTTYRVYEYGSDGTYLGRHPGTEALISPTTATGSTGIAVGADERLYVDYGSVGAGEVHILAPIPPPPPPTLLPVTDIAATSAKLSGEVTVASLGSQGFDTSWRFEYSVNGSKWTSAPIPDAILGSTAGTYPVERLLSGLAPNTEYVARLAAISPGGTTRSDDIVEFSTATEKPGLDSVFSESVSPTEMILGAEIDANGLPTTYHVEWGADAGVYPNRVPTFERHVGSGSSAVAAQESISGLQPNTTYHFRVVAENAAGQTVSENQELLTVNSGGLPGDRGIEMVSPVDKGPVGFIGGLISEQRYVQIAESGSGITFPIFNGLKDDTGGGIVSHRALRTEDGWRTSQVGSPALVPSPEINGNGSARASYARFFNPDLNCAVVESYNPLSEDTPAADIANGVINLYRWNGDDGSYTRITTRSPINPLTAVPNGGQGGQYYGIPGATPDCSRVYFRAISPLGGGSPYALFPNASGIYEWEGGVVRDAGLRPDGSPITPNTDGIVAFGNDTGIHIERNTVSRNGRLFFMGVSNEVEDNGKRAVFVRRNPAEVVNTSKPTSGNPTLGARYETASPDGSKVFFLANRGLTSELSNGPVEDCSLIIEPGMIACDLYRYDVESETLTNLTATTAPDNPRGAVVQGVVDTSEDGSVVYFAARGQLVPGKGRTYAENVNGTQAFANLYRHEEGQLDYVGSVDDGTMKRGGRSVLIRTHHSWAARTTATGDVLLFPSRDSFGNENTGGLAQLFVYSVEMGSTVCISCPRDREPAHSARFIVGEPSAATGNYTRRALSDDGRVVFSSPVPLLPGAVEGVQEEGADTSKNTDNVYEWHRGQLSLLAKGRVSVAGISPDGTDVYIQSVDPLVPDDTDLPFDIYDFRIGSVTPPPSVPVIPCDPGADQCQGAPTPAPASPSPASSSFSGPGNPPPPAARKAKKNKKKAKKNRRKSRRAKQRRQRAKAKARARKRAAKFNRGGAK